MRRRIIPLFQGFPGKTSRGFLGWSSAYLIEKPSNDRIKRYLFDTAGYNERILLLEKLQEHGIQPEEIDGVILSHLHFDHAVNWTLFPKASIYVHPVELEYALKKEVDPAVPEFHAEALQRHANMILVENGDQIDGMEVVETPGHTPGSFSLKIDDQMLVGDAVKNRLELIHGPLGNNTWNHAIAYQSIRRIIKEVTKIYPGHDVPLVKVQNKWFPIGHAEEIISLQIPKDETTLSIKIRYNSKEVR